MPALNVLDWAARILIGALAWPVRLLAVGLLAVAAVACVANDAPSPAGTALPTATATALPPTQPPPTQPLPTSPPTLPPPPTRPENPAEVEGGSVAGGQWYVLQQCVSFYAPGGYTFAIHIALNDPGGFISLAFQVQGTESAVVFHADTAQELGRTVLDSNLGPVFDQIAATISRDC